jgi:uncharacterized protein YbaR (Trm112 family)
VPQPETFACPDCEGVLFVVMHGDALARPKLKCHACGACWFIGSEGAGDA